MALPVSTLDRNSVATFVASRKATASKAKVKAAEIEISLLNIQKNKYTKNKLHIKNRAYHMHSGGMARKAPEPPKYILEIKASRGIWAGASSSSSSDSSKGSLVATL